MTNIISATQMGLFTSIPRKAAFSVFATHRRLPKQKEFDEDRKGKSPPPIET
jgi:hypothetical protein